MKGSTTVNRLISAFATLFMLMGIAGCGSGGSGSADSAGGTSSPTGTVSVLFTDAPSEDFAQINLTVTAIELRGGQGGPVRVFDGMQSFDLLALENFSQLFSVADGVPAGTYSKVRLRVSDLELVRTDAAGTLVETVHPPLPANGKIDVVAGNPFTILPGGALLLEIDIDADESIHVTETGNGGYRFRPVIRLRVVGNELTNRLTRIAGEILALDRAGGTFEICDPDVAMMQAAAGDDDDADVDEDANDDGDADADEDANDDGDADSDTDADRDRACVSVNLLAESAIFDVNGDPADVNALFDMEPATVVGQLRVDDHNGDGDNDEDSDTGGTSAETGADDSAGNGTDDADSDSASGSDSDAPGLQSVVLDAAVVELGPAGTFANVRGVIAVDATTQVITITADDDSSGTAGAVLTVQLQTGARVFNRDEGETNAAAIVDGARAEIDGVLVPDAAAPTAIKAVLVVIEPAAP